MAYRRRTASRRRAPARAGSYRSRSYAPRRRRSTGRRTRSYGGSAARTIKIVVEQVAPGAIPGQPASIGLKQAPGPKKAKF